MASLHFCNSTGSSAMAAEQDAGCLMHPLPLRMVPKQCSYMGH